MNWQTVGELREALKDFSDDTLFCVMWEGIFHTWDEIYVAPNGTVVMDTDNCFYKQYILDGRKVP